MCSHYDHHPACRCDGSTPTTSEYDAGTAQDFSTEELGAIPPLRHGEGIHPFGTLYHESPSYGEQCQHQGPLFGNEAVGEETAHAPYSDVRHHHRPSKSDISRTRRPPFHNAPAPRPPDFHPNNPYAVRRSGSRPQSVSSQVPDYDASYLEQQQELLALDRRMSMSRPGDQTHNPEYPADWRPPPLRRSNALCRGGHAARPTLDFPARGEYHREDDWESGRIPVHNGAQRNVDYTEGERRPSLKAEIEYGDWRGTGRFSLPPHLR